MVSVFAVFLIGSRSVLCTVRRRRVSPQWESDSRWETAQEQWGLKGKWTSGLSWEQKRYDPNSLRAITPTHAAASWPPPHHLTHTHMHTHTSSNSLRCLLSRSAGPDPVFWTPANCPTHHAVRLSFELYSRRHTWTIAQGDASDTGQEISVYVDEAPPSCAFPQGRQPSNPAISPPPEVRQLWI